MTTQAALGVKQIHPLIASAADPKQADRDQKNIFSNHRLFAQWAQNKSTANLNDL
jgi:hypothetical protein